MRKVLITVIVILSLILAGLVGFIWYESTHVFVDGQAYAKYEEVLDLREEQVTESHYLAVKAQLPDTRIIWNVPFQNSSVSSDVQQLTISSLSEEDIRLLAAYFPDLRKIDASGCRDYAHLAQLDDGLLSRLRLQFVGGAEVRNQGDQDEHAVLRPQLAAHLASGFHEGL